MLRHKRLPYLLYNAADLLLQGCMPLLVLINPTIIRKNAPGVGALFHEIANLLCNCIKQANATSFSSRQ